MLSDLLQKVKFFRRHFITCGTTTEVSQLKWHCHRSVTNGNEVFSACGVKFDPKIKHFVDAEVALPPFPSRFNLRNGGHFAYRPTQNSIPEITQSL